MSAVRQSDTIPSYVIPASDRPISPSHATHRVDDRIEENNNRKIATFWEIILTQFKVSMTSVNLLKLKYIFHHGYIIPACEDFIDIKHATVPTYERGQRES